VYYAAYTYLTGVEPRVARALGSKARNVVFDPRGPVWVVRSDMMFGPQVCRICVCLNVYVSGVWKYLDVYTCNTLQHNATHCNAL